MVKTIPPISAIPHLIINIPCTFNTWRSIGDSRVCDGLIKKSILELTNDKKCLYYKHNTLEADELKTVKFVVIILSQPLKANKVSEYTPVEL